uniref:Uncharacterized protein n=1 Tax=Saccharolobus solfataricus (strain 98/2) TaxID=555311 RepID=D0KNV2_SACS9
MLLLNLVIPKITNVLKLKYVYTVYNYTQNYIMKL